MLPNLINNQLVFLRKGQHVSRGTVVAFNTNVQERVDTGVSTDVLRVIGLPGDRVSFKSNRLRVNGKIVNQAFINKGQNQETSMSIDSGWTLNSLSLNENWPKSQQNIGHVQKNSYFLLADNRNMPTDSRKYGLVKKSQIQGSVYYLSFSHPKRMQAVNSWPNIFFK